LGQRLRYRGWRRVTVTSVPYVCGKRIKAGRNVAGFVVDDQLILNLARHDVLAARARQLILGFRHSPSPQSNPKMPQYGDSRNNLFYLRYIGRNPPRLIACERLGCEISPPNCSMKAWAAGKSEKHQR
jgi:hypothetical protein